MESFHTRVINATTWAQSSLERRCASEQDTSATMSCLKAKALKEEAVFESLRGNVSEFRDARPSRAVRQSESEFRSDELMPHVDKELTNSYHFSSFVLHGLQLLGFFVKPAMKH